LITILRDTNDGVRETAASSLGRLRDERATNPLLWALKDDSWAVRAAAANALKSLGWKPASQEEMAFFEIATGHAGAATHAGEAAVVPLVNELKSDTGFLRRAAAEALEQMNDPRRIQPLLAAARDPDATVRVSAIYALANETTPEVATMLVNTFRDQDPQVRLAAAEVLAKWEDPAYMACFFDLLADSHFEVRLTAVKFLAKRRDPAAAEVLMPLMQDADNDVRLTVAQALGAVRNPIAIEALVLALTDEEKVVRDAAASALEQIDANWTGTESAQRVAPQLEAMAQDRRAWVRSAALQTLGKLRATDGQLHVSP
jgi:HEAT repeat protein